MRTQFLRSLLAFVLIHSTVNAASDSIASGWRKEELIRNVIIFKPDGSAIQKPHHQNVAHATVTGDGTLFAAAYPGPGTGGISLPSGYTFKAIAHAQSGTDKNPGFEGDYIDVVNRHGDGSSKLITRVRAYGPGGRNAAIWSLTTGPHNFNYERMEWHTAWQNLNLGLQTAVDDSKNGYVFYAKVADDTDWMSQAGAFMFGSDPHYERTRGLNFQQFKGVGNKNLEANIVSGWYDGWTSFFDSYGWSGCQKRHVQLMDPMPRSISIYFAAGAKGDSVTYTVASIYDHPSRTYPETSSGRWYTLGIPIPDDNAEWWKRHRQLMTITSGKSSNWNVLGSYNSVQNKWCQQLGGTSDVNKNIPFRIRHRFTRILCLPNGYMAFAEHRPNFGDQNDLQTYIHYGTYNSFSESQYGISGIGIAQPEGSPIDICYKNDEATLFVVALARSTSDIVIYGKNLNSPMSPCYEVGKIAFTTTPKQVCIQNYKDYLVVAWQEDKKIKVGYIWVEKFYQAATSIPILFGASIPVPEYNQYKSVVPCCSQVVFQSQSTKNITLRTFDIQANKVHITFLQEQDANKQTYYYLYNDLSTVLPEEFEQS